MIIYDKNKHTCAVYEIKHSNKVVPQQARHLLNDDKCKVVESKYGPITGKYLLYRGKDQRVGGIQYLNVETFLANLTN